MIELLAKNNNSDSVTNKKCPKLMSERGFSEIIFFNSTLFSMRCTTSWSLKSFLGLQFKVSKTSLTWLQNSMGNIQSSWPSSLTRRFAFCVLLMMNYRISWLLWRGAKAASRLLSNAHHAISTKIASNRNINCSNRVFLAHIMKSGKMAFMRLLSIYLTVKFIKTLDLNEFW